MNNRQKKKKFKYQIEHIKPGDILFLKFDINEVDVDMAYHFYQQIKNIVSEYASIVGMFNTECYVENKEFLKEQIDQLTKLYESIEDEDNGAAAAGR